MGRLQTLSPVTVLTRGRTVILRGTVASDHDRDLAGQLARLEPAVDQVENELIVGQPTTVPPSAPPGP